MAPFSLTLNDLQSRFQGHAIIQYLISQKVNDTDTTISSWVGLRFPLCIGLKT